ETWFLSHLKETEKTWYEVVKRAADILIAIPFAVVTAILTPFIALLIKLSSPGPVFYSQIRVGRNGKLIKIYKFRSMRIDAEASGPQFTAKTASDPRVTSIGRFLRQTRIDELPQIWNVLHGDLSLIGPRPERPEFVTPLVEKMPYYALRHLTRPGLTGWAQVKFLTPTATLDDNLTKLQYDLYYIKNRSLLLDAAILLKTVGIVLRRQGT
ncbi:MAG TPA: sugar transferase, partial [Patescibacteria group bacterium]|nr:sugar transferase [Patescibacteria group bacterium]